ncbi:SMC-Scp complex subunit ScpB [Siminovitchia fortis]|uniref:Segregation and condensation protein B n=1 Tax=Siminovitchia fortis TaxID=254758 RepID=A0A443J3J8_9BACI|nr:SMC-Scp complex subunit ScpB [Siminovitchia fortis]RWR15020.1 SMC-Scp complex subunit ScpB [Siminovitchia fortis]WHY82844.1 SMC-Scp complex subunit ScpB [Siminovitchia fortis]
MKAVNLKAALESLLFAAGDEGLTPKQIGTALDISETEADRLIEDLRDEYESDENRGLTIANLAGTCQLVTKRKFSFVLQKLVENTQTDSISQAALETLAIIAYKQPITRVEIEEIRGVKTERPLRTLLAKGLIREAGRREGIGRAILYATTREFLDYFGLRDIKELPPLPEPAKQKPELAEAGPLYDLRAGTSE